jgi:hypothetical protein
MKRTLLLILVLLLMVDLTKDGFLGNSKVCLSRPATKTFVPATSPENYPDPAQYDCQHDLAYSDLPGLPGDGGSQPVSRQVSPTLQIMHCCHISSAGGLPR